MEDPTPTPRPSDDDIDRRQRIQDGITELQAGIRRNARDFAELRTRLARLLALLDAEDRAAELERARYALPERPLPDPERNP